MSSKMSINLAFTKLKVWTAWTWITHIFNMWTILGLLQMWQKSFAKWASKHWFPLFFPSPSFDLQIWTSAALSISPTQQGVFKLKSIYFLAHNALLPTVEEKRPFFVLLLSYSQVMHLSKLTGWSSTTLLSVCWKRKITSVLMCIYQPSFSRSMKLLKGELPEAEKDQHSLLWTVWWSILWQ